MDSQVQSSPAKLINSRHCDVCHYDPPRDGNVFCLGICFSTTPVVPYHLWWTGSCVLGMYCLDTWILANDSNDTKNSPGSVVSMCGGCCDDFIYAFLDVERRERLLNMVPEF